MNSLSILIILILSSFLMVECEKNIVKLIDPSVNEEFIRYSKKRNEIYKERRNLEESLSVKQFPHGHSKGGRLRHIMDGNHNITSIHNPRKPWMSLYSVDGLHNTEVAVFLISTSFREGLYLRSRFNIDS